MIASCCSSLLLIDHIVYRGKIVLIFPEFTRLSADLPPNEVRVHAQDWPEDKLGELPPKGNIFLEKGAVQRVEPEGHEGALAAFEKFQRIRATDIEPRGWETTFQRLLEDAGGAVACLDVPEHPNSASMRRKANANA